MGHRFHASVALTHVSSSNNINNTVDLGLMCPVDFKTIPRLMLLVVTPIGTCKNVKSDKIITIVYDVNSVNCKVAMQLLTLPHPHDLHVLLRHVETTSRA